MRSKKRKALYEVIGKTKRRSDPEGIYSDSDAVRSNIGDEDYDNLAGFDRQNVRWSTRPKLLQFNDSRIEISISYPLAIAGILAFVLLIALAYRTGQSAAGKMKNLTNSTGRTEQPIRPANRAVETGSIENTENGNITKRKTGLNRIVIQQLDNRKDLEPVKFFFEGFGIQTRIRLINKTYYLVTEDKYDNPEKTGTDGFEAKQKIIRIGAGYNPPAGFAGFGQRPFATAYGMKFDD